MSNSKNALQSMSLRNIFAMEVEQQREAFINNLLSLEKKGPEKSTLENLMRTAHSLKGAARLVQRDDVVELTHHIEEFIIKAQKNEVQLSQNAISILFKAIDFIAKYRNAEQLTADIVSLHNSFVADIIKLLDISAPPIVAELVPQVSSEASDEAALNSTSNSADQNSFVKIDALHLTKLVGLAGEVLVHENQTKGISVTLNQLKRLQLELGNELKKLESAQNGQELAQRIDAVTANRLVDQIEDINQRLSQEFENFAAKGVFLAEQLYREILSGRMRPFSDLSTSLHSMTREVALRLDKQVDLEIVGQHTQVDREILKHLELPLQQIIRNAIDHGIEPATLRQSKSPRGKIKIELHSTSRSLNLRISDDGAGLDIDRIKQVIVSRGLSNQSLVDQMSESEIFEFIFLPGFTSREHATEFSGRGVGLDIVLSQIRQIQGNIKVSSERGLGTRFDISLPLSRAVLKSLLFRAAGHYYALPLAHLKGTLKVNRTELQVLGGNLYLSWEERKIGVVDLSSVLNVKGADADAVAPLSIVILQSQGNLYGLVIDEFCGQEELVLQSLDSRLGRIPDVSAAATLHSGETVIVLNADDIAVSINRMLSADGAIRGTTFETTVAETRKVLVVDDSFTVRELERKLLDSEGYDVSVAVDGADGWNQISSGKFDLLVTDLDMPRINGFELVKMLRTNEKTKEIPVIIISYKEREEDRIKGLEVGADYYLTKGSFHNDTFLKAVKDLIGD